MEQTAEERNLLYLSVSVLRIWQYHSAIESGVGAVVIPVFPIFFDSKPQLPFIGKDDLVQALCFDCPDKGFHPGVHHRSKWRQITGVIIINLHGWLMTLPYLRLTA